MEDQHLDRLLRELPREQVRPGFKARVLARLDAAPPQRARWQPRLAAALTAALTITLGVAGWAGWEHREAERAARITQARQALQELRTEHERIRREVEALPDAPPVLYLGGDEEMDLVLDLGQVRGVRSQRSQRRQGSTRAVRPAARRSETF